MNIATYGRKSVYSDKSDSIKNQQTMCKEYVEMKFPKQIDSFNIYADEGMTGANTDRPDLKRLLSDIEAGFIDCVVVYQLDRISRNVRDFSNIYGILEEHNVKFISVKESLDTSTPIGKAMMYVTSVFAQMERETIAERVSDNMRGLTRRGFWATGSVPEGYKRKSIEIGGKKHYTLEEDPEGAELIRNIYDLFLEDGMTITTMETKFKNENRKTPNGNFFGVNRIYHILSNPVYCSATQEAYDYWKDQGCIMDSDSPKEKWDGTRGVIVYGRRPSKGGKQHHVPKSEWLVTLGLHSAIIPADRWLSAQNRFIDNHFDRQKKYTVPLLKGIIRCGKCGRLLTVATKHLTSSIDRRYFCTKRARQGTEYCDSSSVKCKILDEQVIDILKQIEIDPENIWKYAEQDKKTEEKPKIKSLAPEYERKIAKLTSALADAEDGPAAKYIIKQIEELDRNLQAIRREEDIRHMEERRIQAHKKTVEETAAEIGEFIKNLSDLSPEEMNEAAKGFIRECTWDGNTLFLRF